MDPKTEIASGYTVQQYLSIRESLDSGACSSPAREQITVVLRRRFAERFFEPIARLESGDENDVLTMRPGFAIVILCFVLIETLNSFVEGRPIPLGESKGHFLRFLTERLAISREDAKSLYKAVRNKIMHDGETQDDWKILRGMQNSVVSKKGSVRILNRVPFRKAIEQQFADYFVRLSHPDHVELRARLRDRLDCLCRMGDFSGE